jgi:glucose-1-phosphate thymidylyltransferase
VTQTLKIAIPMAGFGSRMRPHTWSKPKPLIALAGRTVLDFALEQFKSVPDAFDVEFIFIVGPNQEEQVRAHMQQHHPGKVVHYVRQDQMRGQSDALHLAKEYLTGPMLMAFSDTLVETDLSLLSHTDLDGIAWVLPVEDPRRFGVAVVDDGGNVTHLVEKPQEMSNNLVVVGFYYFKSGEQLIAAIEEQKQRNITLKGEFFLADAINIMLEHGARMRTEQVDTWLDAGIPDTVLETNRYMLSHGYDNTAQAARTGVALIPPVYIDPSATVEASVIGPHVSVGPGCELRGVVVSNSIVEANARLENAVLEGSLIGRDAQVSGQQQHLNVGDNSKVI